MSLNSELALASRVLSSLNDQMPAAAKLDVEAEWNDLVLAVNAVSDERTALDAITSWRNTLEAKCRPYLVNERAA